ncbi:MAG: hypothetical protein LH613_07475 [Chamaesiphon sp.]|nr:hypothetical protein [Chamaesiphon sp.]
MVPSNHTPTIVKPTKSHFIGNFWLVSSRSRLTPRRFRCCNVAIGNDSPKADAGVEASIAETNTGTPDLTAIYPV